MTELIIGYALPGKPIAMMMFKTWGYITMAQALQFTSDFKLGHYMKLAPRLMFWGQVIATVIAGTTQLGVQAWMFTNIKGMCTPTQPDGFICPSTEVFGTASIVWGVIGPQRQFSKGQIYYGMVSYVIIRYMPMYSPFFLEGLSFFFLVGVACPFIAWLITLRWPRSWVRYVNFPVIFSGTGLIPPASAVNYVPWAIVGFIFQYVIRRRHFSWWTKYNYVLSASLDSGVAISIVVIFFWYVSVSSQQCFRCLSSAISHSLQYPRNGTIGATNLSTWWGE